MHLAGSRDLGASILPDRSSAKPHTRLLSGLVGLTLRLARPTLVAWAGAIAATALLLGFVAKQAGRAFTSTPSIEKVFRKLGAHGTGAQSYLGVAFLIIALLIAFVAIGQATSTREEESDGHLEHFLVRPVSRGRWLAERVLVSVSVLAACGAIAGVFAWLGAASEHTGLGFATMFSAGLNLVPPAICLLGIGVLTIGVWPRATSVVTYGALAWSLLVEVVGGAVNLNHWILDTSIFHQMTAAPAVAPNWVTGSALVAVGAASVLVGGVLFTRRDLAGE